MAFGRIRKDKVFCISFQRTGTTSTGAFFARAGYRVAVWRVSRKNRWSDLWFRGDYETIFSSGDFKKSQVFEDDPWWCGDFYKVLFHRFPRSRFIQFTRDPDRWFDSMLSHSEGRSLGNTYRHSKLYRRESEYYERFGDITYGNDEIDNLLPLTEDHRSHYTGVYGLRNREISEFFAAHDPSRIVSLELEDPQKWVKLGDYFGISVPDDLEIHSNRSESR